MSRYVAEGLRRAMLLTALSADGRDDEEPDGLVLLAGDNSITVANPAAEMWLAELRAGGRGRAPAGGGRGREPRAQHRRGARAARPIARARVRTVSGLWLLVRGSVLGDDDAAPTAVILEPARSPELAPLIAAAYGLTERERAVTQLVAQGLPTSAIAEQPAHLAVDGAGPSEVDLREGRGEHPRRAHRPCVLRALCAAAHERRASGNERLVRLAGLSRRLLREEEVRFVTAEDEPAAVGRYLGPVHRIGGNDRTQFGRDAALAVLLTFAGLLEVLAGPGAEGSRAVSAVAVVATTLPLAWRRVVPLFPPVAIAIALIAQALLDGFLVGDAATPLVALVIALYSAGRYIERGPAWPLAALCVVATTGTRVVVDPAVDSAAQAGLTLIAVALPLLVGRWVRGQALLQRTFVQRAERLARDRERDAREAAEEERMRIAGDLQVAIAGRLQEIVRGADALPARLRAGDHAAARSLLANIATTARDALSDVRSVLGILRRDGQPPRLTPPAADPLASAGDPASRRRPPSPTPTGPRFRRRGSAPRRSTGCSSAPCSRAPRSTSRSRPRQATG